MIQVSLIQGEVLVEVVSVIAGEREHLLASSLPRDLFGRNIEGHLSYLHVGYRS